MISHTNTKICDIVFLYNAHVIIIVPTIYIITYSKGVRTVVIPAHTKRNTPLLHSGLFNQDLATPVYNKYMINADIELAG